MGLRNLTYGLRNVLYKPRAEQDLDDELRAYLDQLIAKKMRNGMSREQAVREARLELGSLESVKHRVRNVGWERFVTPVVQDLRYALRVMRRAPGVTTVAILTLALGIGANSAMFSIVYGLLYRPLPYPDDDRIAMVHMNFSPQNASRGTLSMADFADWRTRNTAFEKVAAFGFSRFTLRGDTQAERVAGAFVTSDLFSILDTKTVLGRTFQAGEDSPSAPDLVVISTSLWQRRFHGAHDIIGRVIDVEGSPATIIGVVGDSVAFPRAECELWQNMRLKFTRRGPFFYRGIGRLRPGVTLAQAQAETNLIGRGIEQANPNNYSRLTMPVEPLRNYLVGDLRPALLMMFGAVALVLLIATVNIANLLLARATTRIREMAVRLSLGAGRRRLIQQLLTESVLLAVIGAAASLLLAFALLRVFRAFKPADLPLLYQVRLDWTVVLFTFVVSIAAGILFGLAPALQSARGDLHVSANSGGRSGYTTARHHRARSLLVAVEMALSLVLLVGSGLLLRSFMLLQQADVGTSAPPENVLTMVLAPKTLHAAENRISNRDSVGRFYERVLEQVSHHPGVELAGISDSLPPDAEGESDTFSILGQPWSDQAFPSTTIARVSPDYFRSLGVPLLRGRFFSDADTAKSTPVVIISASLAKRYFANVDPIGQKIRASGPTNTDPYMDVVGVVGDLKYNGPEEEFRPAYYVPYTQDVAPATFLVVRSSRSASALAPIISNEIRAIDKDAVVRRTMTLQEALDESVAQPRFRTLVVTGFGALALVLAAIGIYGVIAYSVTQRTQEIGIRMALGAQRSNVLTMVISNGMSLAIAGVAAGLAVSLAAAKIMRGFLFATTPHDPFVLIGGCALLLAVAMTATLIPAVRATRIDPQAALRHE